MTTDRRELLVAEEAGWVEIIDLVSSLTSEQLEERGYSDDGWSVKDLIAHIGAWHAEAARVLREIRIGTYERRGLDVDALNREFYEANQDLSASLVTAESAASRNRMIAEWKVLPRITAEAGEWFRESGPEHYAEHLPRLRQWVLAIRSR
ncbi:MAG: ClbS/DfsB family four-helix bundle protein [Actinomycetota bacterium]|nr:ClbS/DfsB family four-helix bundle protein [Actinomycetota bacterium]